MALIQARQIQAIMTVPQSLSFSAQLSNSTVATCWHVELSMFSLHVQPSPRFIQHHSTFIQVLLFENSPWANLGAVLAQQQKKLMSTKA